MIFILCVPCAIMVPCLIVRAISAEIKGEDGFASAFFAGLLFAVAVVGPVWYLSYYI